MITNISNEAFEAVLASIDSAIVARAIKMPSEHAALEQMFEAFQRLKELGWSEAIYCPKDGSMFSSIEPGSTGIHESNYTGEWPEGSWWTYDGDMWPSRPILWRPRKESDPKINNGLTMDYHCCHVDNTQKASTCPTCNGNDRENYCAYPGEGKTGCLRDIRLAAKS